jgi:tRNA (guanine37-N1)-methyltransferase
MMRFDILTLFPEMFRSPFEKSIIKRAIASKLVDIRVYNIRDYSKDKHRTTDDYPYGGGDGMVMKPEPIVEGIESIKKNCPKARVVLMTPQGVRFSQEEAKRLSKCESLILICGRYEGVDERMRKRWVDEELSIGDFVLTGGEMAAMVVIDTVVRLIPGVLGSNGSIDSFYQGLLEYPQYTRPYSYQGMRVPDVLLSGNHKEIARWRRRESLKRTMERRPDLLKGAKLSKEDETLLAEIRNGANQD